MSATKVARRRFGLTIGIALLISACGGGSSSDNDTGTGSQEMTSTTTPPVDTTASSANDGTDPGDDGSGISPTGEGTATITIAGTTVEFENFTCYYDQDAVETFENDDLIFASFGQNGSSTLVVTTIDSPFGPNHTVFYSPTNDRSQAWQRVGEDAATVVDGEISSTGDFERIVDGQRTEEFDQGSVSASCD